MPCSHPAFGQSADCKKGHGSRENLEYSGEAEPSVPRSDGRLMGRKSDKNFGQNRPNAQLGDWKRTEINNLVNSYLNMHRNQLFYSNLIHPITISIRPNRDCFDSLRCLKFRRADIRHSPASKGHNITSKAILFIKPWVTSCDPEFPPRLRQRNRTSRHRYRSVRMRQAARVLEKRRTFSELI